MLGSLTLGRDGTGDFPARRGCHRPKSSGILYPKRLGRLPPLDGDARTCTTEPEETKHPILQRRRLVAERSGVRGWQDLRAVHDSRGLCSESGPFMARSSRGVFPNGCLRGISDAWRAYLAKASSFRMHGVRILPGRGPFPVRGLFWDTPGQNIAIVRHPGTHNVNISPPPGAWECISRAPCRRRTAESALRAHVAMRWPPGNTIRGHMPPCPTAR